MSDSTKMYLYVALKVMQGATILAVLVGAMAVESYVYEYISETDHGHQESN